jgi:extradiol dioxygenase family protein
VWGALYKKLLQSHQEVTTEFTFMENKVGEHVSFFIKDPNGYMIEFKSFKSKNEVFSS